MDKKIKIIKAAIQLFGENGFVATPTSRIARKAEVSNGTLFHYFSTKDELIDGCYHYCQLNMQKVLKEEIKQIDPLKEIVRTIWFYSIVWALENYDSFIFMEKYRHSNYFERYIENKDNLSFFMQITEKGIKEGIYKPLPTFFIYDTVTSQAISSVYYLKKNPKEISNSSFLDLLFSSVWDGLRIIK